MLIKQHSSIIYLAGFLISISVLMSICNFVLVDKNAKKNMYALRYEEPDIIDVIFLGNSHANNAFLPMDLWENYGYTAYISDVIVLPEYQGHGIGKHMLEEIFCFVNENSISGEYISYFLQAATGKEGFYQKFGFVSRPNNEMGAGMTKRINWQQKMRMVI